MSKQSVTTAISENHKQFLKTSDACERQILAIIEDMDLGSIDEDSMDLSMEEFVLGNVLDAVVSQVMILLKERSLKLLLETPEEIKTPSLYGDRIRIPLVLSDLLLHVVHHAPFPDIWIEVKISLGLKHETGMSLSDYNSGSENYNRFLHQIAEFVSDFCYAVSPR